MPNPVWFVNLRGSLGYVTDPANQVAVSNAFEAYPQTAAGLTFGVVSGGNDGDDNPTGGYSGTYPPSFAGRHYVNNTFRECIRVDSGAGTIRVWLFFSDFPGVNQFRVQNLARSSDLATMTAVDASAGAYDSYFWDAAGTRHAWPTGSVIDVSALPYLEFTTDEAGFVATFADTGGASTTSPNCFAWQLYAASETLSITTQPVDTPSGGATPSVFVHASDSGFSGNITATLVGGGSLAGTTIVACTPGVGANFTNLIPSGLGTRHYHFSATGHVPIDSNDFIVTRPFAPFMAYYTSEIDMSRIVPRASTDTTLTKFELFVFDLVTGNPVSGLGPLTVQKRINGATGVGHNATNPGAAAGAGYYAGILTSAELDIAEMSVIKVTLEPIPSGCGVVADVIQIGPATVGVAQPTLDAMSENLVLTATGNGLLAIVDNPTSGKIEVRRKSGDVLISEATRTRSSTPQNPVVRNG